MKYKHVFLIWLLADIFLAAALFILVFGRLLAGFDKEFDGILLLVILYGFAFSLPSLLALTLFYFIYNRKPRSIAEYSKSYILAIIGINLLYCLVTYGANVMDAEFCIFYICSTAAGLLSFYVVFRKLRKAAAENNVPV
ncbi:MAG: hypothetical protein U0V75_18085 [Ferruginibacter sp.]